MSPCKVGVYRCPFQTCGGAFTSLQSADSKLLQHLGVLQCIGRLGRAIFSAAASAAWESNIHGFFVQLSHLQKMAFVRILAGAMITSRVTREHRDNMRRTTQYLDCGCDARMLFFAGKEGDFSDEIAAHNDIVQLDFAEQMNQGKTYRWFAMANMLRASGTFEFDAVFKMDTDTSVDWCGLCEAVAEVTKNSRHYYMGRRNSGGICGDMALCPPVDCVDYSENCWVYMSGGFYGMSAASLYKIMSHPFPKAHAIGHEDLQVGRWFQRVVPDVSIVNIDNGVLWCHDSAFHKSYPSGRHFRRRWVACDK